MWPEILPLQNLLLDIEKRSFIALPRPDNSHSNNTATFQASRIFEDNSACIVLANSESNFKPRTKHIALKWHHFWDYVLNYTLQIIKVATDDNIADIFTRPLVQTKFEKLWYLLMGWDGDFLTKFIMWGR